MTKDIEREALIAEIDHFINEAKKSYIVERWAVTYENSNPFSHTINDKNEVWWMKTQARQLWDFWQASKAQAVPEVLKKFCNEHKDPAWRGRLTEYDKGYSDCCIAVLEMIEAHEISQ